MQTLMNVLQELINSQTDKSCVTATSKELFEQLKADHSLEETLETQTDEQEDEEGNVTIHSYSCRKIEFQGYAVITNLDE